MEIKEKPLISVIVPVFNTENYIKKCLTSIINQSLANIEIILVNDGSNDNSLEILKKFAEKDSRILIIDKKNEGQAIARNIAIEKANGEFLSFIDSDDYIDLATFETLYNFAKKYCNDITTCNVSRFNREKKWKGRLHRISIPKKKVSSTTMIKCPKLIYDTSVSNKIVKKTFWQKNNFSFLEGRYYEDILLSSQLYCSSDSIGICPKVTYYWRDREGENRSTTQKLTDVKNLYDRIFVINELSEIYKSNHKYENLLACHYKKILNHDLLLFINKINEGDETFQKEFIDLSNDLLKEIPKEAYDGLGLSNKLRYQAIKEKNIKILEKIVIYYKRYQKKKLPIKFLLTFKDALRDRVLFETFKLILKVK